MADDMKSGMMSMLKTMLPEEEPPKNVVAKFVQAELVKILDDSDEAGIMSTIFVDVANNHPKDVLKSLIELYNDIGSFVTNLTEISVSGDHEDLEEPDFEVIDDTKEIEDDDDSPEGEPELDETIDEPENTEELEEIVKDIEEEIVDKIVKETEESDEPDDDGPEEYVTIRKMDLDKYLKTKK